MVVGLETYKEQFFKKVDNAPLVLFRAAFGLLLAAEGFGAILAGWVQRAYITPKFTFVFIPFDFLTPLPGNGMYFYFFLMGSFGIMIMLGWYYRIAAIGYFLLWSGAYLMQKTNYNNHYYLMVLLTFVMIFLPANRAFSLDAKRKPELASNACYQGIIWFFIIQSFIFYAFASIAKWNADWIAYNSVQQLFASKIEYPLIGGLLAAEWFQVIISWGGIIFDFLVIPAMLWRKTRKMTLFVALFFHLFNSVVFQIGIFPYMAMALMLFFYDGNELRSFFNGKWKILKVIEEGNRIELSEKLKNGIYYSVIIWFIIQLALPLRHHLIEGNVNWTEEGHRMSWRMMLRTKQGTLDLKVHDNDTDEIHFVDILSYLTPKQHAKVVTHPDMLWQFIQILKKEYQGKNISIYARSSVSLNGGPYFPLYKSDFDLAKVEWEPFRHAEWIWPYPGANLEGNESSK